MCKSSSAQCLSDVCNLPNRLKTKGTEHNQFRYEARWNSRSTESLINTKYGSTDEWSAEDSWHFLTWSWDSWTDEGVDSSPPPHPTPTPPPETSSQQGERERERHIMRQWRKQLHRFGLFAFLSPFNTKCPLDYCWSCCGVSHVWMCLSPLRPGLIFICQEKQV